MQIGEGTTTHKKSGVFNVDKFCSLFFLSSISLLVLWTWEVRASSSSCASVQWLLSSGDQPMFSQIMSSRKKKKPNTTNKISSLFSVSLILGPRISSESPMVFEHFSLYWEEATLQTTHQKEIEICEWKVLTHSVCLPSKKDKTGFHLPPHLPSSWLLPDGAPTSKSRKAMLSSSKAIRRSERESLQMCDFWIIRRKKNKIRWWEGDMKKWDWGNWDELVGTVARIVTENTLKYDEGIGNRPESQAGGREKLKIKRRCEKAEGRL